MYKLAKLYLIFFNFININGYNVLFNKISVNNKNNYLNSKSNILMKFELKFNQFSSKIKD